MFKVLKYRLGQLLILIVLVSVYVGVLALAKNDYDSTRELRCDRMTRASDEGRCDPPPPAEQKEPEQPQRKTTGPLHSVQSGYDRVCLGPGGDCVEYMLQHRPAYCVWVSDLAAIGAWFRRGDASTGHAPLTLEQTLKQVNPQLKRPLTANESDHINFWLTWGWIAGGVSDPFDVQLRAESACRNHEAGPEKDAGLPGFGKHS